MVVVVMKNVSDIVKKKNSTTLKQSFINAMKNREFKEYRNTLKVEEEILMKYTSTLEEASGEYHNCKNCSNLLMCKNKIEGYQLMPQREKDTLSFSYVMCPYKKKQEEDNRYLQNISYYNLSKELQQASFQKLYKDDVSRFPIIKYMTDFMKSYENHEDTKGLYLTGSFGTGKTYLISALFNDMAKKGVKSAIVYYPEFLRDLKASFQTDYQEKFNYIKKCALLLLDDIGAENVSSFNRDEVLGPILQYRMEESLPTFFTSNLTLEELEENLSITTRASDRVKARRIIERIKQLTRQMELVSENRRV